MDAFNEIAARTAQVGYEVCTGFVKPIDTVDRTPDQYQVPEVQVLSQPGSSWAQQVDAIETPFVAMYDNEEYRANPALAMMGFFELRGILQNLGVTSQAQTERTRQPLKGQEAFVVGTGPGREVVWYSIFGATVEGLDATKGYVELTREKVITAQQALGRRLPVKALYQCPAESFQWPKGAYNFISCLFGVLNHIQEWKATLSKLIGALKPNGKLFLSVYGPNEALVFRLLEQLRLNYAPSILQRRAEGGILLGSEGEILPANFPSPGEISTALTGAGLEVTKMNGYLRIAALFPQNPTQENLRLYKELVSEIDPALGSRLERITNSDEILLRSFLFDQRYQRDINDFPYIGFFAKKT